MTTPSLFSNVECFSTLVSAAIIAASMALIGFRTDLASRFVPEETAVRSLHIDHWPRACHGNIVTIKLGTMLGNGRSTPVRKGFA
jgi:hypothetical protein